MGCAEVSCISGGRAAFMAVMKASGATSSSRVASMISHSPAAPTERAEAKVRRICGLKPLE